ncbi:MAG: carboxymuconolactone decarboxylase family protein [Actinomycetota bacterium]
MPRLHQVPRSDDNAPVVALMYRLLFGDRDPVAEPGTDTGTPGDWWTVFANSPDVLEHACQGFGLYQSDTRALDPVLRELGQTRAGYAAGSQFVFSQHCKSLRGLGVADDKIAAVPAWAASDLFDDTERLVLAYTDCLVLELGRVPDALFDALRDALGDVALLELTYVTTLYLQHAVMSKALRTEWDDVEDRITEVQVDGAEDALLRITADDA